MDNLITGVICAVLGFMFGGALAVAALTEDHQTTSVYNYAIAECATVENSELRNTTGIAKYEVTFADGQYTNIECIK